MIVTLTPNPSLDRTIEIDGLAHGEVHRALSSRVDPGGKGVNVSRVLVANGVDTVAVVPTGGPEGRQLSDLLELTGVRTVGVPLASPTRSNITLVEPDGATTKINEPGPVLSGEETRALADRVVELAEDAEWVVLCGSLPRGVPAALYSDLVTRLHAIGARVAVDTSGDALAAAVQAGPDLIKPNDEELAELVGAELTTWGDVAERAEKLRADGVGAVLVSLGADGALLVDADGVRRAYTGKVTVRSTVAAGDSTLTGFLIGGARGEDALRNAVAFGAAAVGLPGSAAVSPQDIHLDRVTVEAHPDLSHPLKGASA
jgi:1-phosphofructokinase